MKIDQSKFINNNHNEFTHQRALQHYLNKVPEFFIEGASNIKDISYDEDTITVFYYDKDEILKKVFYSLVGPAGSKGETGTAGPKGPTGDKGETNLATVHDYHAVYTNLNPAINASSKPGTNHFIMAENIPLNNDFHYLFYLSHGIKANEHLLDIQFIDEHNQILDLSNCKIYGRLVLVFKYFTGSQIALQPSKEIFYLDIQYNNNTININNLNVDIPHYDINNPNRPFPNIPDDIEYGIYALPYEFQFFIDTNYSKHAHTIT